MLAELTTQEKHRLLRAAEIITQNHRHPVPDWNEEQLLAELGITRKTLSNWHSAGKILPEMFTTGAGGKRFYFSHKIKTIKT